MSEPRSSRLSDYIRHLARPRKYGTASEEAKKRPSLTMIGEVSGLGKRKLDHKLAGRANWTRQEVLAVCSAIGGDVDYIMRAWNDDGDARGKPGNPNGWAAVHEKNSPKPEKSLDRRIQP